MSSHNAEKKILIDRIGPFEISAYNALFEVYLFALTLSPWVYETDSSISAFGHIHW